MSRYDKQYHKTWYKIRRSKEMASPEARIAAILKGARARAKQKELKFDIMLKDLLPLPEFCPLLGIRLDYGINKAWVPNGPSLDRLDPTKGYIKGNVRVVSCRANKIKCDATPAELRLIADNVDKLTRSN